MHNPNIRIEFKIYGENANDFLDSASDLVKTVAGPGVSASGHYTNADRAVLVLEFEPDVHPSIPVLWVENTIMSAVARTNVQIGSWAVTHHGLNDVGRQVETA